MKKFVVGMLCGVVLSTVTAVSAAAPLKTFLTKATIGLHINGTESTTEPDDAELLTYNDRIYVPLRWFSEKMGTTVDYLPAANGQLSHVDLFLENNSSFTVSDATKSVSIGHVKVDLGDKTDPSNKKPKITGVIKADKAIAKSKEVVLELLDNDGNVVALTEFVMAGGRNDYRQTGAKSLSEFKAGEVRAFSTNFPFINPFDHYQVGIKLVDSTAWRFEQDGSYAQQETPFDVGLSPDFDLSKPVKTGSTLTFTARITNATSKPLRVVNAQFEMSIGSIKLGKTIWTNKFIPLKQTMVPGHNGALVISVPWKASYPAGDYGVELKTPITVQYEEDGELKTTTANPGVFTNAMFPFTIKN